MERLQVLEPEDTPEQATWYDLILRGQSPSARVGHNCLYLPPTEDDGKGKVIIVGGANPRGSFSDAYIVDLDSHEWDIPDWENLLPRYEHASFLSSGNPGSVWVFGGAEQAGNRNCVQILRLETGTWKSPKVNGSPPSPRTFHTSSAAIGDDLYVFGGGDKGTEPVDDPQLHVFNSATLTWNQPETSGKPPAPRHGHAMVAVGTKLFVHGGLSGDTFFQDMFCIDTNDMEWKKLKVKGDVPEGCAAHSAAACGKHIYIFGGMDSHGSVNSMYKFDTENLSWTLLRFDSPMPPGRLDHSMCVIPWKVRSDPIESGEGAKQMNKDEDESAVSETVSDKDGGDSSRIQENGCKPQKSVQLCLIFGGMDTAGEIYNDCVVTMLEQ
ncbi:rab9 effector protein with kelch motifs isoform X2 [Ambystoma mexicanum]|uniref:rab9 effector protein with kelch motifs isoform X2 n=1 Tax=Ambystoma mexicanum TaxID=8296 RepID=UPI0037E87941